MSTQPEPTTLSERELVLTRVLEAPPEKVFRAWTEPELIKQWFAPLPWTVTRVENDVRPGGTSLIVMRSPEGVEYAEPGVYLDAGRMKPPPK